MGICGLLSQLKSIQRPIQMKDLQGKKVAVDAFNWLHLALYPCAEDLYHKRPYINKMQKYFMSRVRRLIDMDIDVLIVFDGLKLPAKQETHVDRKEKRTKNYEQISRYLHVDVDMARKYMQSSIQITQEHVRAIQQMLDRQNVKYIVAPYEADAQLAYLGRNNQVDYVITEDSDLLAYGCPRVIFKLDKMEKGQGMLVELDKLGKCKELSFKNWKLTEFRTLCILCGCDYLDNIPGVGLKKAHKFVDKYKTIEKIVFNMRATRVQVPSGYLEKFKRIERMFVFQYVFDPVQECIIHLTPVPEAHQDKVEEWGLGIKLEKEDAKQLCYGKVDARKYQPQSQPLPVEDKENQVPVRRTKSLPPKNKEPPVLIDLTNSVQISSFSKTIDENSVVTSRRVSNLEFRNMVAPPVKKFKKEVTNPFFKKWLEN